MLSPRRGRSSGTAIRAATSPARSILIGCSRTRFRSAWMARAALSTTSSPNDCGAPSNTSKPFADATSAWMRPPGSRGVATSWIGRSSCCSRILSSPMSQPTTASDCTALSTLSPPWSSCVRRSAPTFVAARPSQSVGDGGSAWSDQYRGNRPEPLLRTPPISAQTARRLSTMMDQVGPIRPERKSYCHMTRATLMRGVLCYACSSLRSRSAFR